VAVLGLGIGLGYAALGTMAVEHVAPTKTAAVGGVNALVRLVGSSPAGAVGAAVLSTGGPGLELRHRRDLSPHLSGEHPALAEALNRVRAEHRVGPWSTRRSSSNSSPS
jgi:hypothetical protein